jgi:hypothetical protein
VADEQQKQPEKEAPKENENKKQEPRRPELEPEKVLFSWKAAARPFKKRDKRFWTTVISIATLFGIILFLIEGAMPVILIISIIFLYYILSTVPPNEIEYAITNKGVKIADRTTEWGLTNRYWFAERLGSDLLVFETFVLPGRLELVIKKEDKDKLKKVLGKYVLYEEVPPSNLDRAADWFAKKLPGN